MPVRVSDVLEVKDILLKAYGLPLDIIDAIIDHAEYWPHTTMKTKDLSWASTPLRLRRDTGDNRFILRSLPLGYPPEETENDLLVATDDYYDLNQPPKPRTIDSLDVSKSTTETVLKRWASQSFPRGKHPCRKVVFTIRSRDQGWGGDAEHRGSYKGSYTWFDAGLERLEGVNTLKLKDNKELSLSEIFQPLFQVGRRDPPILCDAYTILPGIKDPAVSYNLEFDHPFLPPPTRIQSNVTAGPEIKEHIITWSYNDCIKPESLEGEELEEQGRGRASATGEFVRSLEVGDIITVWARKRFHGWRNNVEEVRIDVYWAV